MNTGLQWRLGLDMIIINIVQMSSYDHGVKYIETILNKMNILWNWNCANFQENELLARLFELILVDQSNMDLLMISIMGW